MYTVDYHTKIRNKANFGTLQRPINQVSCQPWNNCLNYTSTVCRATNYRLTAIQSV